MYTATITSQGTVTIPIEYREEYGFQSGDSVVFEKGTNGLQIKKPMTLKELQQRNLEIIKRNGTMNALHNYQSGDGMRAHIKQKYGVK